MSIEREAIWAPLPNTTRAVTTHLSYDKKSDRIASVENPEESVQFTNHTYNTSVAKFSPSGFYIASGDESGNVKIWDTVGEDLIVKGEYQIINGRINDIAWDADSQRIIAVGNGKERYGHAFTWDSGNTVGEISGHSAQINAVTIKPNRPYRAATVGDDSSLVFFQGPPFRFDSSSRGNHTNFVRDVKYSPNGEFLVSVGADRNIVVYDGKTGEFVKKIGEGKHDGGIFAISWINEEKFVTSSADATIKLWNVKDGELLKTWTLDRKLENQQVGVIATEKYIIGLSFSGDLNYFTEDSETPVKTIQGHQKSITASTLTSNGLITGSYDGRISKWDLKTSSATYEPGHSNLIAGFANVDNDSVYSVGWDDTIKSLDGSKSSSLPGQPKGVSSSENLVAIVTEEELVGFSKGSEIFKVSLPSTATSVGVSQEYIAVGFQNNNIILFNSSIGSKEFDLPPTRASPSYLSFSPNGESLAVGDVSGKIILYNVTKREIQTSRWVFHTGRINSISWNKDNNKVVSGSLDTNIIVYQVDKPIKNFKFLGAHKDGVNTVEWINENEIISGGNDSTLKKWILKA
ncbi:putative WD repeat-containing protein [Wickerhamomyces ciferrii]|uniref:WD repeat-containing protein n=1 Tax=Wickerhamomyces ciferrii (strain ATCC 14091 / BCRC 22168 / CBS 111 / JCM 3599 / NBRC 0793 / NRRL Y-1031 F-60-10) TaxID=1206466 RepID=K0KU63_WICCF|nr:putative WD repeat-containing protein [Wickerhamomyces ciferrii]CCH45562.1 putative WD repeat-containing protein [Wickerhamomyces ciferrii]